MGKFKYGYTVKGVELGWQDMFEIHNAYLHQRELEFLTENYELTSEEADDVANAVIDLRDNAADNYYLLYDDAFEAAGVEMKPIIHKDD